MLIHSRLTCNTPTLFALVKFFKLIAVKTTVYNFRNDGNVSSMYLLKMIINEPTFPKNDFRVYVFSSIGKLNALVPFVNTYVFYNVTYFSRK